MDRPDSELLVGTSAEKYQTTQQILRRIFEDRRNKWERTFPNLLIFLLVEDLSVVAVAVVQ